MTPKARYKQKLGRLSVLSQKSFLRRHINGGFWMVGFWKGRDGKDGVAAALVLRWVYTRKTQEYTP